MWFVSARYRGASVNKDAFIFFWLTRTLLWSLSWFSWTHCDKRFMSPCPWTPSVCGNCAVYCPLFRQKRACWELILVFPMESSSASVAEHWAACSVTWGGTDLHWNPRPEHGFREMVVWDKHGFPALHCGSWCSMLVGFSVHFSISIDGFGGVTSFHRALVTNDAAAIAPLRFHDGTEALITLTPSFQI